MTYLIFNTSNSFEKSGAPKIFLPQKPLLMKNPVMILAQIKMHKKWLHENTLL